MNREASFVTAAYRAILLRDPDPLGMDHHLRMLEDDATGQFVLTSLLDSPEYRERVNPTRCLAIMPCYDFKVLAPTGSWMLNGLEHGDDYEPYVAKRSEKLVAAIACSTLAQTSAFSRSWRPRSQVKR